jgi:hypothetical protein
LDERSSDGGKANAKASSAPWPVAAWLMVPARASSRVFTVGNHRGALFRRFDGVLVGLPTAEVDERHVACEPRRIAGKHAGLAYQTVRESMLEAGLRWPSRKDQWRPKGASLERKRRAQTGGTC